MVDSIEDAALSGDNSPWIRLFKNESRVKILTAFLNRHYASMDAEEVSQLADVSESTFYRNIGALLSTEIVEKDESGSYRLRRDTEIADALMQTHHELYQHYQEVLEHTESTLDEKLRTIEKDVPVGNHSEDSDVKQADKPATDTSDFKIDKPVY